MEIGSLRQFVKKYKKIIGVFFIVAIGCFILTFFKKEVLVSINGINTPELVLEAKIRFNGDVLAYNELFYLKCVDECDINFLRYAKIMADEYDYKEAYFDVFSILIECNPSIKYGEGSFESLSREQKIEALFYLKKAIKVGDQDGIKFKDSLLVWSKIPNSK